MPHAHFASCSVAAVFLFWIEIILSIICVVSLSIDSIFSVPRIGIPPY